MTVKVILETLIERVKTSSKLTVLTKHKMVDLIVDENRCQGVWVAHVDGIESIFANDVILACGGTGGLYQNTTSFPHIKGDGIGVALKYQIRLSQISLVQVHPTAFYEAKVGRRFLITEVIRGEGAFLRNHRLERFVDELKPRDIVSSAILEEMKKEDKAFVWLDCSPLGKDGHIRFPNIYDYLNERGLSPENELIPIVPAHHYTIGGILVDMDSKTSLSHLYAVGEVANTGVHGYNRLASNSLLECVVFAKRAVRAILAEKNEPICQKFLRHLLKQSILGYSFKKR